MSVPGSSTRSMPPSRTPRPARRRRRQNFGTPINHFVELNFDSFQNIVNTFGGINMYLPDRVYDDSSGLHSARQVRAPGRLNALALVRARDYWYFKGGQWRDDGSGDLGRILRVHEFLRVLATAVGRGLLEPDHRQRPARRGGPGPRDRLEPVIGDMFDLLRAFGSTIQHQVPELTMPNIENFADYMYQGSDLGPSCCRPTLRTREPSTKFLGLKDHRLSAVAPGFVTVWVANPGRPRPVRPRRPPAELSSAPARRGGHLVRRHRSARSRSGRLTTRRVCSTPSGSSRTSTASSRWPRDRPTPVQT